MCAYVPIDKLSRGHHPCLLGYSKEGIVLRNGSASLVLSVHFHGGGIHQLGNRSGKE